MQRVWQEGVGQRLEAMLLLLPRRHHKAIGRWVRGRAEHRKLQRADCVLMSWGKSGRTWLRVMLSRFYQLAYGLPEGVMLEFDNLHRANPAIPSVFFTHGNYVRDYTNIWDSKSPFYPKRILLLVRDPRDIAVSQYFQWKYRMRPVKRLLNDYPEQDGLSIYDFMMNRDAGLPRIIDFLEIWDASCRRCANRWCCATRTCAPIRKPRCAGRWPSWARRAATSRSARLRPMRPTTT